MLKYTKLVVWRNPTIERKIRGKEKFWKLGFFMFHSRPFKIKEGFFESASYKICLFSNPFSFGRNSLTCCNMEAFECDQLNSSDDKPVDTSDDQHTFKGKQN